MRWKFNRHLGVREVYFETFKVPIDTEIVNFMFKLFATVLHFFQMHCKVLLFVLRTYLEEMWFLNVLMVILTNLHSLNFLLN